MDGYLRAKRIRNWINLREQKEEYLDRKVKADKLTKIDNSKFWLTPTVCPCCFRTHGYSEMNLHWLADACGGWNNITHIGCSGSYIWVQLEKGSEFRARCLNGSGMYAYKYIIDDITLGGQLILLCPDPIDSHRVKDVVTDLINTRVKRRWPKH